MARPVPRRPRTRVVASHRGITVHQQGASRLGAAWLAGPGAEWSDDISDPETANGLCQDVSEDFAPWTTSRGHVVECGDLSNDGPHTVALLDGVTVADFTFRQSYPDADIPEITDLDRLATGGWTVTARWTI